MSLKSRLAADETLCTAWSGVPDALTVEILARQGFDAVTLDMQHGGHHEDSVLRGLGPVLAANKPALVRIPVGRFDMASRALDFGAEAVIAPMVNSVADARLFAAAMKYPPLGERSWGPTYAFPRHGKGDYADWLRDSNARTMAFAMVETRAALDALDGILDTPGIDGIFLGPS
ncbi:MAG: 2,4-dihydroxyhept-2-ene-1,7-dioic acid aldolase, partial [Mesorhizobium sp.]